MKKRKVERTRWLCLLVVVCCSIHYVAAQTDKTVTVQLKEASIRSVFDEIKKQADVGFMYTNSAISTLPKKDYEFHNVSISTILSYGLEGSELTFEIENNKNIIIKRKHSKIEITGTVQYMNGDPVIGATVQEKGVRNGTTTDMNGHFSIYSQSTSNVQLIVSFIGLKQQIVTWKGGG